MAGQFPDATERTANGWAIIGHHDFGGQTELDSTIIHALGAEECCEEPPLYEAVNTEHAERFLRSVDGDDASVVFAVKEQTVRVSADGTVAVRDLTAASD